MNNANRAINTCVRIISDSIKIIPLGSCSWPPWVERARHWGCQNTQTLRKRYLLLRVKKNLLRPGLQIFQVFLLTMHALAQTNWDLTFFSNWDRVPENWSNCKDDPETDPAPLRLLWLTKFRHYRWNLECIISWNYAVRRLKNGLRIYEYVFNFWQD